MPGRGGASARSDGAVRGRAGPLVRISRRATCGQGPRSPSAQTRLIATTGESVTAVQANEDGPFGSLSPDQRRLLQEFGRHGVRFIVIGGYAVRFYGRLRPAHDLDLVVECGEANLQEIRASLEALGAQRTDQVAGRLASGARQIVRWNDTELWSASFDRDYACLARDAVKVRIGGMATLLIFERPSHRCET